MALGRVAAKLRWPATSGTRTKTASDAVKRCIELVRTVSIDAGGFFVFADRRARRSKVRAMTVLRTPKQAAERLQTSVEQLIGFVHDGELRYVNLGRGKKRPRRMFTDDDLDEFIERRKRGEAIGLCLYTNQQNRRTGNLTSSSEVIAFTARPSARPAAKPKR